MLADFLTVRGRLPGVQPGCSPFWASEPRSHCALCVKAPEFATHDCLRKVVPEPAFVLPGSGAVRAEVRVGQLAECSTADETTDRLVLYGPPRVCFERRLRHAE